MRFCFVILCSLFFILSCDGRAKSVANMSNILLEEINSDLLTWDMTKTGGDDLKRHLSESLVRKILMVGAAKPQVSLLSTTSIETICKLNSSKYQEIFEYPRNKDFVKLATDYLRVIKKESDARLMDLQKVFGGQECRALKI